MTDKGSESDSMTLEETHARASVVRDGRESRKRARDDGEVKECVAQVNRVLDRLEKSDNPIDVGEWELGPMAYKLIGEYFTIRQQTADRMTIH